MEEVIKVALLGSDFNHIEKVSKKINKDRPTDVHPFTDLNDFLKFCMSEKPEIVGISVSFSHKSTANFPKIFKMAMNVPTFSFYERYSSQTDKLLNASSAEHKVTSPLSATNLWMRIANISKEKEKEVQKRKTGNSSEDTLGHTNSIHLTGSSANNQHDQASLNSILKALDQADNESEFDIKKNDEANKNSSSDDEIKNENSQFSSEGENNGPKIDSRDVRSIKNIDDNIEPNEKDDPSAVQKGRPETLKNSNQSLSKESEDKNRGLGGLHPEMEGSSTNNNQSRSSMGTIDPESSKDAKSFEPKNLKKQNDSPKELIKKPEFSPGKEVKKGKDFGSIKLSDQDQVKKEDRKKKKENEKKKNLIKQNILKTSSELGLQSTYLSQGTENYQPFSVNFLSTFIVESGPFKGILVLATTAELGTEELVDDFRVAVIANLKKNNIQCEISKEYPISMEVDRYQDVVKKFAEFSINFSDSDGNQQNVFYVSRESVRPSFQESNLQDMFEVDIKVIPPQTPVNFDAFVHLPRNKKFVRYLKEGRSLSLKQAKRHSEEEQNTLYLPKDQKDKFIAFFIKNTLNWDFTLHQKASKKSA